MRKWYVILLVLAALLIFALPAYAAQIKIFVDGREIKSDVPPVIEQGRTLVPIRVISEALGAQVTFDKSTLTVTISGTKSTIVLKISSNKATKNGTVVILDAPARVISGRTMVPLRFIGESLGAEVKWNTTLNRVEIDRRPREQELFVVRVSHYDGSFRIQETAGKIRFVWGEMIDKTERDAARKYWDADYYHPESDIDFGIYISLEDLARISGYSFRFTKEVAMLRSQDHILVIPHIYPFRFDFRVTPIAQAVNENTKLTTSFDDDYATRFLKNMGVLENFEDYRWRIQFDSREREWPPQPPIFTPDPPVLLHEGRLRLWWGPGFVLFKDKPYIHTRSLTFVTRAIEETLFRKASSTPVNFCYTVWLSGRTKEARQMANTLHKPIYFTDLEFNTELRQLLKEEEKGELEYLSRAPAYVKSIRERIKQLSQFSLTEQEENELINLATQVIREVVANQPRDLREYYHAALVFSLNSFIPTREEQTKGGLLIWPHRSSL